MAVVFPTASYKWNNKVFPWPNSCLLPSFSIPCNRRLLSTNRVFSYPLHGRRRISLSLPSDTSRCLAAKSPPPPPDSDPPPGSGLSKLQDRIQIFFAVLFWMSLFFWACVWDDRSRPNKGSRFRR
ncbi:uncharacterized protein LOC107407555 isoform X2 [Ziziphus jujuba]|uniref:Uncharacterized protein LOC107407555 isoform X2 n=1 Tax=Ziziphus jujuba TaxID=326968 RepID=A0A6P3YZL8_ZIZJJ|nr:uncharacterized protein LOC107407555 isoform X2 [Ziziphus jujuba]